MRIQDFAEGAPVGSIPIVGMVLLRMVMKHRISRNLSNCAVPLSGKSCRPVPRRTVYRRALFSGQRYARSDVGLEGARARGSCETRRAPAR